MVLTATESSCVSDDLILWFCAELSAYCQNINSYNLTLCQDVLFVRKRLYLFVQPREVKMLGITIYVNRYI